MLRSDATKHPAAFETRRPHCPYDVREARMRGVAHMLSALEVWPRDDVPPCARAQGGSKSPDTRMRWFPGWLDAMDVRLLPWHITEEVPWRVEARC